ncbi:hypothetical protein THRCLA_03746 [Thraustotheca clavata]|uniref:FYVE-type domain-containing protein n=1 Tax=Thraustotheca clavata TaxID=74557 RepID=A0A1W0A194_9STRA|nr:hypothetical protein THRCLA_03746 [Thraustotheca clavata]
MVLPLGPDHFTCPELSPEERDALVHLGRTICQDTVQNALVLDGQPIHATISNTTTRRRARIRKGFDCRDSTIEAMSCYTQIRATLDEVADVFYLNSTMKLRTFGRVLGKAILDKQTLYKLVDRPVERSRLSNPLHYIGVEWAAVDVPLGFAKRDFCYLEAHDEFEFVDTANRKRRGWVRAIHSIKMVEACPSMRKSHGLVRGCICRSGHVFIESENNPGMLDYYNVIAGDPRGRMVPKSVLSRFMKAHVSQALNLEEHLMLSRMQNTTDTLSRRSASLNSMRSTPNCMICASHFGFFNSRKTCDQCFKIICKSCSSMWTKASGFKKTQTRICKSCSNTTGDLQVLTTMTPALPATQYTLRSELQPPPRRTKPVPRQFQPVSEAGSESDVIMLWDDGQASKRGGTFTFLSSSTSLHHTLRTNVSGYQSSFYSYQYSEDGSQIPMDRPSSTIDASVDRFKPDDVDDDKKPVESYEPEAMPGIISPSNSNDSDIFDAVYDFARALPFVSVAGWAAIVQYERNKANHPARGYTFVTGSMDDMVMDTLQTGDLVLFKRNCAFLPPKDGFTCFLSGHVKDWEARYNHCGFILVNRLGQKFIVEETYAGVKCRPYSARIITSLSSEIVVVPLKVKRTIAMQQAVNQFVQENVNRPTRFSLQLVLDKMAGKENQEIPNHPAASLITEVYQRMGLLPEKETIGFLHPSTATIKDLSSYRRIKLLNDAEFTQMLPIRLL